MKNIVLKFATLFICLFALSSAVQASTIYVTPYFSFMYKDINAPSYTYTIHYAIENSDHVLTQWYQLSSTTFPPNQWNTFQASSSIPVTEPAGPPIPVLCYRYVMIFDRSDGTRVRGVSAWATAAGLQNNSLTISVLFP